MSSQESRRPGNGEDVAAAGKERLHHLDALRGLAALGVAIHHSLYAFKGIPINEILRGLLGDVPVIFFFLLSGFVLSRSLMKGGRGDNDTLGANGILGYNVRRVFRLYPAVVAALIFSAIAARFYLQPAAWTPATDWLRYFIKSAASLDTLRDYANALAFKDTRLDNPLWTIKIEFVCSFLLPFLLLSLRSFPILIMPAGALLAFYMGVMPTSYPPLYLFAFYMGFLVERYTPALRQIPVKLTQWILFFGVLQLIFAVQGLFNWAGETIVLAGMLAVLVPCNWPRMKDFLQTPILQFLGRISFSFYLLHIPVFFLCWGFLQTRLPGVLCLPRPILPAVIILLLSVVLTAGLAALFEKTVERPFNRMGHRLANRWFSIA